MAVSEMWEQARPLTEWVAKCRREGREPKWEDLTFVDLRCAAYGDWILYRDTDGAYYEDYASLGD